MYNIFKYKNNNKNANLENIWPIKKLVKKH